jgi:lysophospholipase L1-like esterase
MGDSITAWGWPEKLAAMDPGISLLANAGVGGNSTVQMLARFDGDVLAYRPELVTIMGGTNDTAFPEPFTISNLRTMVDRGKASSAFVILLTIPPRGDPVYTDTIRSLNAAIRQLGRDEGVMVVDAYAALANPDGTWREGLDCGDGIHPSPAGLQAIADAVRARL